MKPARLIPITAVLFAVAVPTASASPAGARASKPTASTPASIVLVGLTVPLGIALVHFAVKPAFAQRHRRSPAGVA